MGRYAEDYLPTEAMVVAGARELRDGDRIFAGAGLPLLSTILAMRLGKELTVGIEAGTVGSTFPEDGIHKKSPLPRFVCDPRFLAGATYIGSLLDLNGIFSPRRKFDVGFIGGAQVDKYGNLNSTIIGDWKSPKLWLPGSGGACDMAMYCNRILILIGHSKRTFVEKVDFITSPGYIDGPGGRERNGLKWGGPTAAISDLGIMQFDEGTKEMYVEYTFPGVTVDQIKEHTAWDIKVSPTIKEYEPPTESEIEIIRHIDRDGLYTRRKG